MSLFQKAAFLLAAAACFTGCETNVPQHGRKAKPSILISLHEQRAYLRQGPVVVSETAISTGREGHATPTGKFHVIRKDIDHRSGIYGAYVDARGYVVKADVDRRKDSAPPGTHYVGAPMPYFVEFLPGFGLHEGNRPGYPASHGCVRLPRWRARQFFEASRIGTPVTVRP